MAKKRLAPQERELYRGDERILGVDCSGVLDAGETLVGTPTVTDESGQLAISQEQVNTTEVVINELKVPIGRAVLFMVERGAAPDGNYELDLLVTTSAGQTIPGAVKVICV
jgi:hypothetical protein